jgi:GDP-L-fucose synthase
MSCSAPGARLSSSPVRPELCYGLALVTMAKSKLSGRRVLVTGGGGFLGSHLVRLLEQRGVDGVYVPRAREWDLRQPNRVVELFEMARPDVVFHLAASVGGIGANRRSPGRFFYDNMAMGLHVIEAVRRCSVSKLVVTGTVCSYPKFTAVPFREGELWNGYPEETNAAYGIAKRALLTMAQAYRQEYGTNVVMPLPVNLYGPGDNFDLETSHVIPAMIRKFVEARDARATTVTLWGDGTPTREFLHVRDAARGLLAVAESYDDPEPINLGTGSEVSMRELGALIRRITGFGGEVRWDPSMPNGQQRRALDVSRARDGLGFVAEEPLEAGLLETLRWYENEASARLTEQRASLGLDASKNSPRRAPS